MNIEFLRLCLPGQGIVIAQHRISATKCLGGEDLLKQLECPVCMEYMLSSAILCEKGNSICTAASHLYLPVEAVET
jgi:hypothetical protein